MIVVKAKRCLRRVPNVALARFIEPIFNSGQILAFFASVIGLALYLRLGPSPEQRDLVASEWALGIQAFIMALIVWALFSLATAPFLVIRDDRRKGSWHGHHFIYHRPYLVATERLEEEGGRSQRRQIRFEDAEPNGFAYYTIELMPKAPGRVGVHVVGGKPAEDVELTEGWVTPSGEQHIGVRIPKDRRATMLARLKPETVPIICRIWCHSLYVGKSDMDGA